MEHWGNLLWLVVLLAVNAFFVAAEFALVSARRAQIEPKAQAGSRRAKTTLWAMEHTTLMLATCQLGITVCSLLILGIAEPAMHHILSVPLHALAIPELALEILSFSLTLVIVTYLHVVIGEMVPKNAAFSLPDQAALLLAQPLVFISKLIQPFTVFLNLIADKVLRLFNIEPKNEASNTVSLEEVETIVQQSAAEKTFEDKTGALQNVFEFLNKQLRDLVIPCEKLVTLPVTATPLDLERAVARYGFSRYPIVNSVGQFIGYIHVKDMLSLKEERLRQEIAGHKIRQFHSYQENLDLEDALARMQARGAHIVKVYSADGEQRFLGVVFLEDIIEELIGKIHDATSRQNPSR